MNSKAATVAEYLAGLSAERRAAVQAVRAVVNANLPAGYREGVQYGMLGWAIPLADFPQTYNGQPLGIAALASQKQYLSLYLMGVYGDVQLLARLRDGFARAGKQLDMGKSCVRFASVDDLALDAVAEVIRAVPPERLIAMHEAVHAGRRKPAAKAKPAVKAKAKPVVKAKAKRKAR